MTKLIVDGKEIEVPPEYTLLQACEAGGAEIPRFCFHERLSIAGNCRMCLVELVGSPKPIASCAWAVRDCRPGPKGELPEVKTRSPMVRKAREGVMEFLLINHPLDCPICDQGGECDLQDQSMAYGTMAAASQENKRAVEDKYLGPLVKTSMNRCIQCTRCVRFATEVAGVPELGAIGRGEDMEITTYLEEAMRSELQGNVVDICPVGALTSKPYAFAARPWELNKTESVDAMDALGCAIRIDTRGSEVMRILPRTNDDINEEWISDKTRHVVDGLRTQRLDQPYLRDRGRLRPATWTEAFNAIAAKVAQVNPGRIGAIAGDLAAVEEVFALKDLMTRLSVGNLDCRQDGSALDPAWGRAGYLFNATIAGIDAADALLIVGSNPRKEATILNARIRKRWRAGKFPIGVIGPKADLTYNYDYLGAGPETLAAMTRHSFADALRAAERPMLLVGAGAFARGDGAAVASLAAKAALDLGAVKDRLERLLRAARRRLARGSARCRLRAGAGRLDGAADGGVRHARRSVSSRRRRDRYRQGRLRRLYRHARRPRRVAGRCGAARRGLSGKIGDLCQHRRPDADGDAGVLPARRRARRLGDFQGAVGPSEKPAALRLACGIAPGAVQGAPASHADRPDRAGRRRRYPKARRARRYRRQGAVRVERRRLLLHQSDRARLGGDGGMFGARPRALDHDGGGVEATMAAFLWDYIWPLVIMLAESSCSSS